MEEPGTATGRIRVQASSSPIKGYALAALLGAIGGGLMVALATRAIPRMMAATMQAMMECMGEDGRDLPDM